MQELFWRKSSRIHLKDYPRHSAQSFVMMNNFFRNFLRIADDQCSIWPSLSFKIGTRDRRPAAFFANFCKSSSIAWKKFVARFLRSLCNVSERMQAHLHLVCRVPASSKGLFVEFNK